VERDEFNGFSNVEESKVTEIDLIQKGYQLNVFPVFGDDPYTIPIIMLTKAWMKSIALKDKHETHLWKYVSEAFKKLNNAYKPADHTYRTIMDKLKERGIVKPIQFHNGRRPKCDYVLTEYGEEVCEKLKESVWAQIRLERWRRRALETGAHLKI
jgi:DNA-binding PadR family transcriptional regulator